MKSSSHPILTYLHSVFTRQGAATEDDSELLRRMAERRDEEAFTVLLRRHGPMVLSLARRIVGDEPTAEDVFQATFLWLFRKGHAIRRPQSLSCWLHGVAHRLALQARRAAGRRRRQEALSRPVSPPNPLDELTAQEFLGVLDEELTKLPEKYRGPLILCCLEGLSQEEAAQRLRCSADAVRGRLERGRRRLRLRLQKRGLTLPAALGGMLLIGGATSPVPAALVQTTLQAAATGRDASAAVAALLEEAMRMTFINKCKAIGAIVILLAVTGTGVAMMSLRPQALPESAPRGAGDDKPLSSKKHIDLYGDPLPDRATLRLGTVQRRAVNATLALSADGKSIVSVRGGRSIRIWDALTGALRQTRELPDDPMKRPAVLSKDGRWKARVVYRPERLEIWDMQSGQKVRELTIKDSSKVIGIGEFAFSADGKRIAAIRGGRPKDPKSNFMPSEYFIRAWDIADGKEVFSKTIHPNAYSSFIALTPDGSRLLVSFSSSGEGLNCWDVATGKKLWQLKQFGASSWLEFTRDGKLLASGLGPRILDLATGIAAPISGSPPIRWDSHLKLTPDGNTLLISTTKGAIVWDMVHGKQLRTLPGAGEEVFVTPDGKAVITNSGELQRWDLATGKAVWSDTSELGHIGEVNLVRFSADGRRLVSASTDGTVRLWDAATGRPLRVWHGHHGSRPVRTLPYLKSGVKALDIAANGRRILSVGTDECIKVWDIGSDKEICTIVLPRAQSGVTSQRVYQVRISSDGRRVIGIFGPDGVITVVGQLPPKLTNKLALWDAETGNLLDLQPVAMGGGFLSPDGHTLLTRDSVIDVRSGKTIAKLPDIYTNFPEAGAFSHDGALIVWHASKKKKKENGINVIDADGLRVWEAATGKIVVRMDTKFWVAQTAFHPNNRFIATNDLFGIHIRDASSGEVVAHYQMPEAVRSGTTPGSFAACLAFSRDGRRMATGMPDGTILMWNVSLPPVRKVQLTAKELETLWADLADADAEKAWRAVWRLADAPQDALPFLRGRVKPSPIAAAEVMRKLLADLDSDSFEVRESAAKRLKELRFQAEPALRSALDAKPSLEQRRRIEELLAALPVAPPPTPEELRQLRALIVLERIGTPEARRLLEEAAKGPTSARLTRLARLSLACIR